MPVSNTFIALDLELTQPSSRIIQVGVAIGARGQAESEFVVRQWLLDPGEQLTEFIVGLTGITDQDIAERGVPWEQMAKELGALIDEHKPFVNPVTWGGGDSRELLEALSARSIDFPYFGHRWLDAKTYHAFSQLAQGKSPTAGLRSAMGKYGLTFKGEPHRADVDAFNTLRLFMRMLERQAGLERLVAQAKAL